LRAWIQKLSQQQHWLIFLHQLTNNTLKSDPERDIRQSQHRSFLADCDALLTVYPLTGVIN
jgi:hypothetical protein